MRSAVVVLVLLVLSACGDGASPKMLDPAGKLTFASDGGTDGSAGALGAAGTSGAGGAGGVDGTAGTAGVLAATACGPAASVGSDGVLSAFPKIVTSVTPSQFVFKTINYVVTEDGDARGPLLEVYAEFENIGSDVECGFLPEVTLGFDSLVGTVDAPAHFSDVTMHVVDECLSPGDVGVMQAVQRGISETALAAADSLTVDLNPNNFSPHSHALGGPVVTSMDVVPSASGWALRGKLAVTDTIYNYMLTVYARDSRGVLVDRLLAFPGDLHTLVAGDVLDFETDGAPCKFEEFLQYQTWIAGPER